MTIKLTPSEEMQLAAQALLGTKLNIKVETGTQGEFITVPKSLIEIVQQLVSEIAKGNSLTIITNEKEISTTEAAEILEVSRQHLIELLESGELPIPFRKVGKHRRLRLEDVINFKQRIDQQRLEVLSQLAEQAQELKLGYE
ncbi:MAG: helix-turn-helix domain-containing protein [Gomphosphaeria aponina SAG 52.96 = DSM 107014]|uniref:Helix-turn-helix domain-containing protein n=1 Tax=Gomphosphaeria aponina SAG 52.96 = DSM 107014 TaxID=1521640 RepID=A0A941GTJ4_9CHRO|nr:helix-turn-helix domain-containing protein [Gomphosphaeria aponina SAG 52.96 = DSM 107014]